MTNLFEKSDTLNTPIECFSFDSTEQEFPVKHHWHYFAEAILMQKGTAIVVVEDARYIIRPGDFFFFHPSAVHSIFSENGRDIVFLGLKFDINRFTQSPAYAPKMPQILKLAKEAGSRIYFPANEAEALDCPRIFTDCLTEIRNFRYGYDLALSGNIYRLLLNMTRYWIANGLVIHKKVVSTDDTLQMESVTRYIDETLSSGCYVNDIAEKCHLSYSCFARRFRELYGMSCKKYIEKMRIYKAEEFLLFTDYDMNYISQETGFSDCSHFIKTFKKYRGVPPFQYRKEHR